MVLGLTQVVMPRALAHTPGHTKRIIFEGTSPGFEVVAPPLAARAGKGRRFVGEAELLIHDTFGANPMSVPVQIMQHYNPRRDRSRYILKTRRATERATGVKLRGRMRTSGAPEGVRRVRVTLRHPGYPKVAVTAPGQVAILGPAGTSTTTTTLAAGGSTTTTTLPGPAPVFAGPEFVVATGPESIMLAWRPAADDRTRPADMAYEVHLGPTGDFAPTPTTRHDTIVGDTQATITGLAMDTTYHVAMIAVDEDGRTSTAHDPWEITTLPFDVALNPGVALQRAEVLGLGSPEISGSTLTFAPGPGATPPTIGAVLIGTAEGATFLRRVESVAVMGDQVVVETSDAALAEAVDQIAIRSSTRLFDVAEASVAVPATNSAALRRVGAGRTNRMVWDHGLVIAEQVDVISESEEVRVAPAAEPGGYQLQFRTSAIEIVPGVSIDADLGFEPTLDVETVWSTASTGLPELQAAELVGSGKLAVEIGAQYELAGETTFERTRTFASRSIRSVYFVGPVPVEQRVTLSLEAQVRVEAAAAISAGATASASAYVEVGVRYDPTTREWQPVTTGPDFETGLATHLDVHGEVVGEVRIVPKIEVAFYEVLAGDLSVQPYAAAEVTASNTAIDRCPVQLDTFDVGLGAECLANVRLDVLIAEIPFVEDMQVCGPFELPVFSLPDVSLRSCGGGDSFAIFADVREGTGNPLERGSIEWDISPRTSEIIPTGDGTEATLRCMSGSRYTITFSGHGALGEAGRRCRQVIVECGTEPVTFEKVEALSGRADDDVTVWGVSGDGSVVVGSSLTRDGRHHAFRWTSTGGTEDLGVLPDADGSAALDVSDDGSVIVGASSRTGEWTRAFRWTAEEGMIDLEFDRLWDKCLVPCAAWANAVSGDGSVVAGQTYHFRPVLWTEEAGPVLFELPSPDIAVGPLALDYDGQVIVGQAGVFSPTFVVSPPYQAFRWTVAGGVEMLGFLAEKPYRGFMQSGGKAVSADGRVVAGSASVTGQTTCGSSRPFPNVPTLELPQFGAALPPYNGTAFRWERGNGMTEIGDLPGGRIVAVPNGASHDGSTIVGWSFANDYTDEVQCGCGTSNSPPGCVKGGSTVRAFLWDAQNGMRDVARLASCTGTDAPASLFKHAMDVSRDGRTIVGYGTRVVGSGSRAYTHDEGWIMRLP